MAKTESSSEFMLITQFMIILGQGLSLLCYYSACGWVWYSVRAATALEIGDTLCCWPIREPQWDILYHKPDTRCVSPPAPPPCFCVFYQCQWQLLLCHRSVRAFVWENVRSVKESLVPSVYLQNSWGNAQVHAFLLWWRGISCWNASRIWWLCQSPLMGMFKAVGFMLWLNSHIAFERFECTD